MQRSIIVALAIMLGIGQAPACGQELDEAARLRKEIELLKKEVDLLKRENELLRKENAVLRKEAAAKTPAPKPEPAKPLPDLLIEGTVLPGTYAASVGRSGICSLTIKERSGNKFKGILFYKPKDNKGEGPDYEVEVEGTITASGMSYRTVGTPNAMVAIGKRKGDYLELVGAGSQGARARATVKLPK